MSPRENAVVTKGASARQRHPGTRRAEKRSRLIWASVAPSSAWLLDEDADLSVGGALSMNPSPTRSCSMSKRQQAASHDSTPPEEAGRVRALEADAGPVGQLLLGAGVALVAVAFLGALDDGIATQRPPNPLDAPRSELSPAVVPLVEQVSAAAVVPPELSSAGSAVSAPSASCTYSWNPAGRAPGSFSCTPPRAPREHRRAIGGSGPVSADGTLSGWRVGPALRRVSRLSVFAHPLQERGLAVSKPASARGRGAVNVRHRTW